MGPRRPKRKTETPRKRIASPTPATPRPTPTTPRPPRATPRPPPSTGPSFRRRRRRHLILREIKNLQKSTQLLLRKTPFCRLAREICVKFTRGVDFNWQAHALLALQELFSQIALTRTPPQPAHDLVPNLNARPEEKENRL
ncbi:histone H3-like centromeric protein A isoform X2 [Artibeus jamaicensis]|uniref:histone H3-like centromeric protein A isoform X2 n=1 Tax=Artibeus jamaicensis TaxID=9417 RepID=UPI00235AC174|nr:histone H3-like centromeric protein A isoform X2 [Artibeus jamaicensis]